MTAIGLGLLAAAFFATTAVAQSRTVKPIDPWSTVGWMTAIGPVIVLPFTMAAGIPAVVTQKWPWLVLAGVGNTGGLLLVAWRTASARWASSPRFWPRAGPSPRSSRHSSESQ